MIYFDNSASSPLSPGVKEVLRGELELFANPSSLHRLGFEGEMRLKEARKTVAKTLYAREDEIVFTSGGTEADNLGVLSAAKRMGRRGNRILATDSEHPAVESCLKALEEEGFEVIRLSTRQGKISLEEAAFEANEKTVLLAVMHTNNETGAVYDVAALSAVVKRKNPECLVFCDAVQGYGKTLLSPQQMGVDLMAVSSHKINGPKGVGALYVKKGITLPPRLYGGGQERGIRSGTENLSGIIAFAKAAEESASRLKEARESMNAVKTVIKEGLREEKRVCFNEPVLSSPHILSMQVKPFRSEVLLHELSRREVFVSSGSACSSHSGKSPVLKNFGLTDAERDSTVRLSFSYLNTVEEGKEFVRILQEILG